MTNKDMLDIAKEEMIQMIARKHDDRCEAAKALAFLIMAENKQTIPGIKPIYNSTTNGLDRYECPMCGKEVTGCNYCPNCGATVYSNLGDLINSSQIKFIDMVKGYIDKDSLSIFDTVDNYIICDNRTGDYVYRIDKNTYNIEKISHLKVEPIDDANCECLCKKCKKKKTKIYLTIGLHKVLVDTVNHEVDYRHYRLYEDSQKCCIIKKDGFRRDFKDYSIDKNTLEVKVID